jgi:RNA polymerase sigma factor (sigma-70 family)
LKAAGSRIRLRLAADDRLVALVRRGDRAAFEALYERHSGPLLSFCVYKLGSQHDAEDAIQATFASAYRALRADQRAVTLRPWLYTIARNESLSILRRRRPTVELNGEPALIGDPVRTLEVREEVRDMLRGLGELPERQRAALVLTEVHGLSQAEIGTVLGVRSEQVKAYVFQARSNMVADRDARKDDCREIREELATARGASLLRGRLRRHIRACSTCQAYADSVARQRRQLAALIPIAPSLVLKYRVLGDGLGAGTGDPGTYAGGAVVGGSAATAAAAGLAGGGIKALAVKVAAGVGLLAVTAGVGASVLSGPESTPSSAAGPEVHALVAYAGARSTSQVPAQATNAGGSGPAPQRATGLSGADPAGGRRLGASQPSVTVGDPSTGPDGAPANGAQPDKTAPEHSDVPQPRSNPSAPARAGEEARMKSKEERQHEDEEDQRQAREAKHNSREARNTAHEKREQRIEEAHRRTQEEREQVGRSRPPKKTAEERQKAREEREQVGVSRPPRKTAEERQRAREEHREAQEERRKSREARNP